MTVMDPAHFAGGTNESCNRSDRRPADGRSAAPSLPPIISPTASISATPGADVCHDGGGVYCAVNPAVTQATIGTTICRRGWTATVRPPAAYTDQLKRDQLAQFASLHPGDPNWTVAGTKEDHRLPLSLGGAPRDEHNLSPQERPGADQKDADESVIRQHVCSGRLLPVAAQQAFIAKWLAAWPGYKAGHLIMRDWLTNHVTRAALPRPAQPESSRPLHDLLGVPSSAGPVGRHPGAPGADLPADIFQFRSGKIIAQRTYFDFLDVLTQLGVTPAASIAAT